MAKKVNLLCDPNFNFSIGGESFRASELTVEQAGLVAAQYPGQYVDVIDDKPSVGPGKHVEATDESKK